MDDAALDGSMIPRRETRRADHRAEPRFTPESQTATLEFRGRRHVVRMLNVSQSGAMVIFSLIPHIGETIRMQLIGRGLVEARVCWVRDGRIGVTFAAAPEQLRVEMVFSMIKARIAEAADPKDRRQSPRLPVELEVKMRELGASGVEARVLNISEHGFMAESDGRFEVGSRVWLILPGRDRANAVVKWTAGDRLGAEFAEPISLDSLPPLSSQASTAKSSAADAAPVPKRGGDETAAALAR